MHSFRLHYNYGEQHCRSARHQIDHAKRRAKCGDYEFSGKLRIFSAVVQILGDYMSRWCAQSGA